MDASATTLAPAAGDTPTIGDVRSSKIGTGARFNAGKVPFDLLPLLPLVQWTSEFGAKGERVSRDIQKRALDVISDLARWQAGDDSGLDEAMVSTGAAKLEDFADCARVFDWGRRTKYAEWNWAKGMPWSVPLGCAIRHCLAILRGELRDHETDLPTMAHVQCNLVMLLTYRDTYPSGDDRPTKWLADTL